MKKYIIGLILTLVSVLTYAQEAKTLPEVNMGVVTVDSAFIKNPLLYTNAFTGDSFADTKLMYEMYQLTDRIYDYQNKQVKGMAIGGGLMALGGLGWAYTLYIVDPPVYQTSNQGLNQSADDAKRHQRIAGWISTAVFAAGATVFAVSFKNHHRLRAEVGLANLRLQYRLFGNREYLQGKKLKKMKARGYYPTRTRKIDTN